MDKLSFHASGTACDLLKPVELLCYLEVHRLPRRTIFHERFEIGFNAGFGDDEDSYCVRRQLGMKMEAIVSVLYELWNNNILCYDEGSFFNVQRPKGFIRGHQFAQEFV